MQYILNIDGQRSVVSSRDQLMARLAQLRGARAFSATLMQDLGQRRGFGRFLDKLLGTSSQLIGGSAYVLAQDEGAVFVVLDQDYCEARAINPGYRGPADARVEFTLATGEKALLLAAECLDVSTALDGLVGFYETGSAPSRFTYVRQE